MVCLFALVVIGIRNLDSKNIVFLDKWVLEILIGGDFAFGVKLLWARAVFRLMTNPSFFLEVVHIVVLGSSFSWAFVLVLDDVDCVFRSRGGLVGTVNLLFPHPFHPFSSQNWSFHFSFYFRKLV